MTETILPCPFCGGPAYATRTVNGTQMFKVGCASCGIELKAAWYRDEPKPTKDLIGLWNTRKAQDEVIATPEGGTGHSPRVGRVARVEYQARRAEPTCSRCGGTGTLDNQNDKSGITSSGEPGPCSACNGSGRAELTQEQEPTCPHGMPWTCQICFARLEALASPQAQDAEPEFTGAELAALRQAFLLRTQDRASGSPAPVPDEQDEK